MAINWTYIGNEEICFINNYQLRRTKEKRNEGKNRTERKYRIVSRG